MYELRINHLKESHRALDKKINGIEKAKLVGKKFAELCLKNNIKEVVFDKGAYIYHGRVKAMAEACREAGLSF